MYIMSMVEIKKLISNTAVFGTFIVTLGIFISSFFSYLLQFGLARLLTVADYGTFNALLSLSNIFAIPNTAFTTSLIKMVTHLKAHERFDKLTNLFWKFTSFEFFLGVTVFLLLLIFQDKLMSYINMSNKIVYILFCVFLGLSFLGTTPAAYLQGLLRFKAYSFFLVLGSVLRVGFPIILVILGYTIGGVYLGMSLAVFITFLTGIVLLVKNFTSYKKENLNEHFKQVLKFVGPVMFVTVGMTLLNNIDLILVKRFFNEMLVGQYAAVMTIGKILLFGAGTVGIVMFPQISQLHAHKQNVIPKFLQFLVMQLAVIIGGVLIFVFFPKVALLTLYDARFYDAVVYVPAFAVFMGLYVLVNFIILFFLALEKTKIVYLLLPAVAIQFSLINIYHANLFEIIYINIGVCTALLIGSLIYIFAHVKSLCSSQ